MESKKDIKFIGFFGAAEKPIYNQIKNQALDNLKEGIQAEFFEEEDYVPCECTD